MTTHVVPTGISAALLLLASSAGAQTVFVETYETGANEGAWKWFGEGFPDIATSGGNPGAYITKLLHTNPGALLGTQADVSLFTGNLALRGVSAVGADLATFLTQEDLTHPDFQLVVEIGHDPGTPFDPTDDTRYAFESGIAPPLVGQGWVSFDFSLPATSPVLPPGWQLVVDPFLPGPPNPLSWSEVVADVSYLRIGYGPTTAIWFITTWSLGADILRVRFDPGPAWSDLGQGLAGTHGEPVLVGAGTLVPGEPVVLTLAHARESSPAFLVLGAAAVDLPLLGGVLVPSPDAVVPLDTSASGALELEIAWPPLPSGFALHAQAWALDPAAPFGVAASNAVLGTSP